MIKSGQTRRWKYAQPSYNEEKGNQPHKPDVSVSVTSAGKGVLQCDAHVVRGSVSMKSSHHSVLIRVHWSFKVSGWKCTSAVDVGYVPLSALRTYNLRHLVDILNQNALQHGTG